jgi:hypothetical protein
VLSGAYITCKKPAKYQQQQKTQAESGQLRADYLHWISRRMKPTPVV